MLGVSRDLLRRQVTLGGSWTFSTNDQEDCNDFVADRGINLDRLFIHRWQLEQADGAYRGNQTSGEDVHELNGR